MTKNVTFNIQQETIDKLSHVKDEYGISKNVLVDKAVNAYIDEERFLKKEKYILVFQSLENNVGHIAYYCDNKEEALNILEEKKQAYTVVYYDIYKILEEC